MMEKVSPALLLFDLDGTLLNSVKQISPRNIQAISDCRSKGIMIGVATARNEPTCQRFVDAIAADVLISNSGALVRLNGEHIFQHSFTREETATLVMAGVAENRGITVDCVETTFSNRVIEFFKGPGITYTDFSGFARSSFKICIEGSDEDFAERTAALIDECSWLSFSDCDWFKFSKNNVSKGHALKHIVRQTGIPLDKIISFGDDLVDLEMIELCGTGVAMENAVDEVRSRADIIIGSNDTDAIADFLEKYIL